MLTIAGSASAGGCMKLFADLVKHNMVDAIVATGATIVDMDFFEALGFKHYRGTQFADDRTLRDLLYRPHLRHLYRRGGTEGVRSYHLQDRQ